MFNHWVVPINSRCSSFLGNIVEWKIINTNRTTIKVSRHTVLQPPRMRGHNIIAHGTICILCAYLCFIGKLLMFLKKYFNCIVDRILC